MNLLYALTAYPPYLGGAQLHQHYLAQHLKFRHRIQVVSHWNQNRTDWLMGTTLFAPSKLENYVIDDIPVHRLGLSFKEKVSLIPSVSVYYPLMSWSLQAISRLIEMHLAAFIDTVDLVHNVRIGREGLSYASLNFARSRNIPFVLTPVHHPRWVGWRYQAFLKLYQMADAVIALTESEKTTLTQLGVNEERIHVSGIGPILASSANPEIFIEKYRIDGPMVLFLGQHYSYKGYKEVLKASSLVWRQIPNAQFVFIGPPVTNSEKNFLNIDPRILRLGAVDLQTKTDALAACSLLCVPSLQESFGGVYTEAWSFKKPVIGARIPAVMDVIDDQVDGLLVESEVDFIASSICELLMDPQMAQAMGEMGYQKVQERYTWSKLADCTENIYQNVLTS